MQLIMHCVTCSMERKTKMARMVGLVEILLLCRGLDLVNHKKSCVLIVVCLLQRQACYVMGEEDEKVNDVNKSRSFERMLIP
jgi:hypothetical protein